MRFRFVVNNKKKNNNVNTDKNGVIDSFEISNLLNKLSGLIIDRGIIARFGNVTISNNNNNNIISSNINPCNRSSLRIASASAALSSSLSSSSARQSTRISKHASTLSTHSILLFSDEDVAAFVKEVGGNADCKISLQEIQTWYMSIVYAHVMEILEENVQNLYNIVHHQVTELWPMEDADKQVQLLNNIITTNGDYKKLQCAVEIVYPGDDEEEEEGYQQDNGEAQGSVKNVNESPQTPIVLLHKSRDISRQHMKEQQNTATAKKQRKKSYKEQHKEKIQHKSSGNASNQCVLL